MDRLDRLFGVHGSALALRSQRMQILASNIANAATPGYKARDLDFASVLAGASTPATGPAVTNARHISGTGDAGAKLLYRQPLQSSLDGNSVELATEQLQFTETAIRYRATLSILNGRISGIMTALKGE